MEQRVALRFRTPKESPVVEPIRYDWSGGAGGIMRGSLVFGTSLLFILTLAASGGARADTYLGPCAQNGVLMFAQLTLSYDGAVPTLGDSTTVPDSAGPVVPPGTDVEALVSPPPFLPTTGDAKDNITATMSSRFDFGTPVGATPLDTFEFDLAASASAVAALNFSGNPADAVIGVKAHAVDRG